ncbi:hypothetical protein [Flavilitoribacter nigricans]|uniref:Uncharacterized protein n=1 Tax=Flavilitoribacter nigricans (strain ATCC 23147 / DSM 23189 / NBRC 102662 / NCIMB 1420 / SS-2) TaxID=1122177 RepID=A0A2D0N4H3_FLAN2|nr:hypothetical protein [Flavilitoribacter nigricans]PHN03452.1 hypothetical protein CRP01_27615 [Flavilitoribacter nigricans DSM 23189 = NBRC 102662]
MTQAKNQPSSGNIYFTIPEFEKFGEVLHDRLHGMIYHVEELHSRFMLITNLFDRDPKRIAALREEGKKDLEALCYCGTGRQRYILELEEPEYYIKKNGGQWDREKWQKLRDKNWNELRYRKMTRAMKKVETFDYFDQFRKGEIPEDKQTGLGLEDIKVSDLKIYFKSLDNVLQKNEHPIISDYFDIEKDKYIGIPVLGLGLFQGIVWIVFTDEVTEKFSDRDRIKRLIRLFQMEYDNLALNWQLSGDGISKQSLIDRAIDRMEETNPIQRSCNIRLYYDISEHYHRERIEQNESVTRRVRDQFQKTAIISIMLDAFAKNVSTQSLATLAWWFKEHAEIARLEEELSGAHFNPLIRYSKVVENHPGFSKELYPLFKFLLEKGAFWSGITRQNNFTGEMDDLFHLLWHEFVYNPLYLGTLAVSKQVLKLRIRVTIYSEDRQSVRFRFVKFKTIKKNADGKLLDGEFAVINLEDFQAGLVSRDKSVFVEKGTAFELLRPELEKYRAFFPGGVVGKQAFFTLLENEIRNVKHFRQQTLKNIQEQGLVLNISIFEAYLDTEKEEYALAPELFKIGVWLQHQVRIGADLMLRRIEGLDEDIVSDVSHQPKFGGNHQDKICAALLMTNSFHLVQDKESEIGKIYYPWVKTASQEMEISGGKHIAFEVSSRKYKEPGAVDKIKELMVSKEAHLKKYFHLWRADDIYTIKDREYRKVTMDNLARHRFLHLTRAPLGTYKKYRADGLIRIISKDIPKLAGIADAYQYWMPIWLKADNGNLDFVVDFLERDSPIVRLTFIAGSGADRGGTIQIENAEEIQRTEQDRERLEAYRSIPNRTTVSLVRGARFQTSPKHFNYSPEGALINRFAGGANLAALSRLSEGGAFELLEVVATRICIFNRWIYNRLNLRRDLDVQNGKILSETKSRWQAEHLTSYREKLFLDFREETPEDWEKVKAGGLLSHHFVILNLSFIEEMTDKQGRFYTEERIIEFIDEQILQGTKPESVKRDFVLVIATEGARTTWWDAIAQESAYASFITFRPIESIQEVFEDAVQMADDFQLKYNMVKLLFGS